MYSHQKTVFMFWGLKLACFRSKPFLNVLNTEQSFILISILLIVSVTSSQLLLNYCLSELLYPIFPILTGSDSNFRIIFSVRHVLWTCSTKHKWIDFEFVFKICSRDSGWCYGFLSVNLRHWHFEACYTILWDYLSGQCVAWAVLWIWAVDSGSSANWLLNAICSPVQLFIHASVPFGERKKKSLLINLSINSLSALFS